MELIKEIQERSMDYFINSNLYRRIKNKTVIVFSASNGGRKIVEFLNSYNIDIKYILDNNQKVQGKTYSEIEIVSPEDVVNKIDLLNTVVFVGSLTYMAEITDQLVRLGFCRSSIISPGYISDRFAYYLGDLIDDRKMIKENIKDIEKVISILDDEESRFVYKTIVQNRYDYYLDSDKRYADITIPNQYFNKSVIQFSDNEIMLDAGAYNGDSILEFKKVVNGRFNEIYAFEPEKELYSELIKNTAEDNRIKAVRKGLTNFNGKLNFIESDAGSHIIKTEDQDSDEIEVIMGDSLNIKPTFVKMDIEGEEVKALEGLKNTILQYNPKLAICIYHRCEFKQLWEVPLYIKELNDGYKIKIRHHGYDTVCYALK